MTLITDTSLYCTNHAAFPSDKGPWPRDLIQDLCSKRGLEYKEGYEGRVLERVVAEAGVDRAGRRIVLEGGLYEEYASKPIILWMHNKNESLGYSLRERVEKGVLKSLVLFLPTENPTFETYFRMAKSGTTNASSICIRPIDVEKTEDEIIFKAWSLVAVSICTLWITTEDFGDIYYNDLIKKHLAGNLKGLRFVIYSNEENHEEAHVHVIRDGGEKLASISIETGKITDGKLGPRERAIAKEWYDRDKAKAQKIWDKTRPG